MTVNGYPPSCLGQTCAISRTGQFRPVRPHIAFPSQFCCSLLVISTSDASSRPLKSPVFTIRDRVCGPLQLLAALQFP